MTLAEVTQLVLTCLHDQLEERGGQAPAGLDGSTRLIGRDAVLDSLGLVGLIVDVEQRLGEEHGIGVTIADERAMSQTHSPFRTADTLAAYVQTLIREQRVDA